jgi:hypothetical protein
VHAFDPPTLALSGPVLPVLAGTPAVLALTTFLPTGASWEGYAVDLGDGSDDTSYVGAPPATIAPVFDTPGDYVITVAVQDDAGGTAVASYEITVV